MILETLVGWNQWWSAFWLAHPVFFYVMAVIAICIVVLQFIKRW